ncbi:MAG: thioredoxin family protein [candidate division Zixibacteria bacterium]|nr:thioredoxin family protein [candidate division Zixibacteria bacterium]
MNESKIIKVLGPGCPKCEKLLELTKQAVEESGENYLVEKISDIMEIMKYGVAITPALIVNDEVKVMGKVPSVDEIKQMIE